VDIHNSRAVTKNSALTGPASAEPFWREAYCLISAFQ
jgi:hypothetical protein